jgi:hypothetical protein
MRIIFLVRGIVHAEFQIGVLENKGTLNETTANERPAGICLQNGKMS